MKICAIILSTFLCSAAYTETDSFVTYELSPGRFGDNLMSYYHAKWIAYKYDVPLLYKPFCYSDELALHEYELHYSQMPGYYHERICKLIDPPKAEMLKQENVLFFIPYFPESTWEKKNCISFEGKPWEYFEIDWEDPQFIEELRKVIRPRYLQKTWELPKDRISVAIHMRKGGYHDTPPTLLSFPLKFLPDEFYIEQLEKLHAIVDHAPLYVFLFTDDPHPILLKQKFEQVFTEANVVFDCRQTENHDKLHVVEDFFALSYFDCLIHSESNFSFCISKVVDYLVQIYPYSFHKEKDRVVIDGVHVKVNHALIEEKRDEKAA